MDAEEVECSQFPGKPLLHLNFKAEYQHRHRHRHHHRHHCINWTSTPWLWIKSVKPTFPGTVLQFSGAKYNDCDHNNRGHIAHLETEHSLIKIIITTIFINQVLLLVMILAKFSWDCVVYHRTGQTNIIFGNNCSTSLLPQVNCHGWLESFAGASQESREPVGQTQPCGLLPHPQTLSAKSPVWSQASPVQEGEMSTFEHTAILTHLHWAQQIFSFFLEGDLAQVVPEQWDRGGGGQLWLHHLLQLQQQVENGNV